MDNLRVLSVILLIGAGGCRKNAPDPSLTISAAASLQDVLPELRRAWAEDHPDRPLLINVGGSAQLARQIQSGARVDLFLSADSAQADRVDGVVARRDLLSNRLVLIGRAGSSRGLDDAARVAVGDPAVPVGAYARRYLEAAGRMGDLKDRLVSTGHVRHVLATVRSGDADLGIVYATDAASDDSVVVVAALDRGLVGPIVYPALALSEDAVALLDWLAGPRARAIFEAGGFEVLPVRPRPEVGAANR